MRGFAHRYFSLLCLLSAFHQGFLLVKSYAITAQQAQALGLFGRSANSAFGSRGGIAGGLLPPLTQTNIDFKQLRITPVPITGFGGFYNDPNNANVFFASNPNDPKGAINQRLFLGLDGSVLSQVGRFVPGFGFAPVSGIVRSLDPRIIERAKQVFYTNDDLFDPVAQKSRNRAALNQLAINRVAANDTERWRLDGGVIIDCTRGVMGNTFVNNTKEEVQGGGGVFKGSDDGPEGLSIRQRYPADDFGKTMELCKKTFMMVANTKLRNPTAPLFTSDNVEIRNDGTLRVKNLEKFMLPQSFGLMVGDSNDIRTCNFESRRGKRPPIPIHKIVMDSYDFLARFNNDIIPKDVTGLKVFYGGPGFINGQAKVRASINNNQSGVTVSGQSRVFEGYKGRFGICAMTSDGTKLASLKGAAVTQSTAAQSLPNTAQVAQEWWCDDAAGMPRFALNAACNFVANAVNCARADSAPFHVATNVGLGDCLDCHLKGNALLTRLGKYKEELSNGTNGLQTFANYLKASQNRFISQLQKAGGFEPRNGVANDMAEPLAALARVQAEKPLGIEEMAREGGWDSEALRRVIETNPALQQKLRYQDGMVTRARWDKEGGYCEAKRLMQGNQFAKGGGPAKAPTGEKHL